MARRSLRPHLNQIRGWVRQGRTDAWIAHQLEVTVQQIEAFKRENDLVPDGDTDGAPVPGAGGGDFDDEIDLRAEDDALIAAELEAAEAARAEEEAAPREEAAAAAAAAEASRRGRRRRGRRRPRRRGRRAQASPRPPRWPRPAQGRRARARGNLRPRRGGLRAVARPRRRGQPRLRRALGRPPARERHDRGGPDRDPPRRRRRRRLTAAPPRGAEARADPLREEGLDDPHVAAVVAHELLALERGHRALHGRRRGQVVAAAVVGRQRPARLIGQGLQQHALLRRGVVPHRGEVRVLRAQHALDRGCRWSRSAASPSAVSCQRK